MACAGTCFARRQASPWREEATVKREVAASESIQGHDQTGGENTMLRFLSRMPLRSGAWRVFVAPVAAVAAFTLPARKAAAQATVDQHVPFSSGAFNPCTGEVFSGSGFFHIKTYETLSPNVHFSSELNIEDFK